MRCSGWGRSGADIGRRTVMAGLGLVALVDISGAAFRRGQEVQRVAADVALVVAPALLVADVRGLQDQLPAGLPGGIGQIVVFDHQGRSIAKLPRSGVSAAVMELGVAQAPIGERAHPGGRVVVVPAWMDIFGRGGLWLLGLSVAYLAASRRLRPLGGVAGSEGAASLEPVPPPVVPAQAPESAGGADRIGMSDGPPAVAASSLPSADVAVEGDGAWPGEPQGAPAATGVGGRESLGPVAASPACSSLLLGIAEETRSALGVVSSMVELLHDSVLEDRQRRYLGQLEWAAGNLDRLAAEVANLAGGGSDLEAPQSIEFSPEALSEAAVLQAHRRGAEASREWVIQVDPALPRRVEGDAARIQAALAKVVEHALRTYPCGDACLRVRLASDRPGAVICWHVHIRPRSARAGGDEPGLRGGVGWQIAEVLVRQAQGVWEEAPLGADEVGVGFGVPVSLVLPAQPPPPVSPAQVAIVTGHAYLGEALGLFLARLGFSVARFLHAETLRAAVHSDGVAPRTVCLDEDFAHDAELVTFLRGRGVQVIALVSRGGSAPEFAARKAGVTAVVGKPVLFGELSAALIESTAPAPPSIVAATPDRKRILVAEDHAINREIVLAMLARLGRVGVAASDGHDAVDQCAREVFDLVLMDIQMPGLDGLEATRSIRRAEQATGRAPVPIVALTANVLEDDRPAAMASGMNDYLAKPITVLRLHEVLERWCSPRTPGRPVSPEDLDLAALKALPGVRGDLASPQAGRYVALFVGESRGQSERLLQAASQGDLQGVAAGCHRLKSAAAGVGAVEVARLARALEASIKSAASQADVIVALDAICVALQRYRDAAVAAGVKWPDADCYAQDPP